MGFGKNVFDVPSRPSSASSYSSNSGAHPSRDYSSQYGGGYGGAPRFGGGYGGGQQQGSGGSFGSSRGEQDFERIDQNLMRANAGSLGIDPSKFPSIKKNFYQEHPDVAALSREQVDEFRKTAQMAIQGTDIPKPVSEFKYAGFPSVLEKKLVALGLTKPTPIQAQGWSMALSGRNMVGIAQTGSGKTLSFVLPAIVHVQSQAPLMRGDGPIVLVLAPTRELAVQIQEVSRVYGNTLRVNSTCLYGGAPKGPQIRAITNGCEIVVATPGRLLDLLNAQIFNLNRCSYLVLDEADRMLDMGFEPQIRKILQMIRLDRQVLMWSATWPKNVQKLAHDMLGRDFIQVKIGSSELSANKKIKQNVILCDSIDKASKLSEVLQEIWAAVPETTDGKQKQMVRTIIFCNKKRIVDALIRKLHEDYWSVIAIHGDKTQYERDSAIRMLKSGQASILVATDVAARGLDVKDVKVVINYDLPGDVENYVHRIGRTARGDCLDGTAYTLVTPEDGSQVGDLIKIMENAGQEVGEELRHMRRGPSMSRGPRYGYGYKRHGGGGGASQGRPNQHIRFNPY